MVGLIPLENGILVRIQVSQPKICYNKFMPHPFRSKKVYEKYEKVKASEALQKGCSLCKKAKSLKNFKHWRIVNNKFPYDKVAKIHHMVIPKRHTIYEELNKIEKEELDLIRATHINLKYEAILEATNKEKSIPDHFHLHLMVMKK
mgnify:CR=1 FL=1